MPNTCHSTLKVYGPSHLAEKARGLIALAFGACVHDHENPFLETEADNPPLAVVRIDSEDAPPTQLVARVSSCGPEFRFELIFDNWASGFRGRRVYQSGVVASGDDERYDVEAELEQPAAACSIVDSGDTRAAHDQMAGLDPDRARHTSDNILQEAKRRANGGRNAEPPADETLQWAHDSWIDQCETAGVYSRTPSPYGYSEQPAIKATLTPAELRILVQRHLNSSFEWTEFFAWNGLAEGAGAARAMIHEVRFKTLVELLPPGEQQRLQQQRAIRQQYVQSVRAEVARCEKAEGDFWARADAGLVCEAEIAAHKTPLFIMGAPVMPPPADGGPGPERWDVFASEE